MAQAIWERAGKRLAVFSTGLHLASMEPRLSCDEMLGGLARWLRAAGYDTAFERGIDDSELIARAAASGRILLSSDSGIFERNIIKNGHVRAVFVPRAAPKIEQLRFVLGALGLPVRAPRCMNCGGALVLLSKEEARNEAPSKTFENTDTFYRCERCGKLLWRGTHWRRIERVLAAAMRAPGLNLQDSRYLGDGLDGNCGE